MKVVVVRPERCVGCLQCRFACSVVHSKGKSQFTAPYETIVSKPRIHIGLTTEREPFPNKCRHCNPAPCEMSCITRAIFRDEDTGIVLINSERCINCGMCAMACPFGVIRYHVFVDKRTSAHKCDQCFQRQKEGKIPACVEVCKVGALIFEDYNKVMDMSTDRLASLVYLGIREKEHEKGSYPTLLAYRNNLQEIKRRQS